MKQQALRAGSHCGGREECRKSDPPQAENPARQDSILKLTSDEVYGGKEKRMEQKKYLISDAAKQVQVESHVLRYWEDELELPIRRNKLGHRYYTAEDVNRLKRVKAMKEQGFQLKAIRRALKQEMQGQGNGTPVPGLDAMEGNATSVQGEDRMEKDTVESQSAEAEAGQVSEGTGAAPDCGEGETLPAAEGGTYAVEHQGMAEKADKSFRLQVLLKNLMLEAIREGNEEFCEQVRDSVIKELDYQFRMQEEREELREKDRVKREEEHYKKVDEMLRDKAAKKEKRKKHSFF